MHRTIGFSLVALAMFSIAGGHWVLLQAVGWAQMLQEYARKASLVEAVSMTFDGKHPCVICLKVKEGRQKEGKAPSMLKDGKKIEGFTIFFPEGLKRPDYFVRDYFHLKCIRRSQHADAPPCPVPIERMQFAVLV